MEESKYRWGRGLKDAKGGVTHENEELKSFLSRC